MPRFARGARSGLLGELREAAGGDAARRRPLQSAQHFERRPSTWPGFPWAELAESADAFAPMIYTGGAYKGFDANCTGT